MPSIVRGTGVRVWGVRVWPPPAIAVTRSATAATAVAKARTTGRDRGRITGMRNPNLGRAAGDERTRLNADATSSLSSGAVIRLEIARASFDTVASRAWHSAQVSRWRLSAPLWASGSSTIRRSVPSDRCATCHLLAQTGFRAPQQCSDLTDTDAECLGDLRVAEAAGAENEHRRGLGREAGQRFADLAAILAHLEELPRIDRTIALFCRLGQLALLPAPRSTQPVQRGVGGRAVQPGGCVLGAGRMKAMEVDEDLLRHVLGLVLVHQDTVRDACPPPVLGSEKGLQRPPPSTTHRHPPPPTLHPPP